MNQRHPAFEGKSKLSAKRKGSLALCLQNGNLQDQQCGTHGQKIGTEGESLPGAHCALLLDYVPPEEPPSTPLGNTLRIR